MLLTPTHLSAQTIRGVVADLETAMGLGGATVLLGDLSGNLVDSSQSNVRGEFTLGARVPSGSVRPWAEVRIGTEYLTNVKTLRLLGPVLTAGIEIGRLEFLSRE